MAFWRSTLRALAVTGVILGNSVIAHAGETRLFSGPIYGGINQAEAECYVQNVGSKSFKISAAPDGIVSIYDENGNAATLTSSNCGDGDVIFPQTLCFARALIPQFGAFSCSVVINIKGVSADSLRAEFEIEALDPTTGNVTSILNHRDLR
jgi:hypothetical protein